MSLTTPMMAGTGSARRSPPVSSQRRRGLRAVRSWLVVSVLAGSTLLSGCSLLSIKTPEVPLTPREQEARFLTRDYAAHFTNVIVRAIDSGTGQDDAAAKAEALRLKLAAVTEITRASTGLSPLGSLLDTWAFALQFRDFIDTARPELGRDVSELADQADELGRKVLAQDYSRYQRFVVDYARRNPLGQVDFVRPSILAAWVADQHDRAPLRSTGTVAQALGDVSDRLRIYGERIPNLTLWRTQVALDRAGFDGATYRNALQDVDAQLGRISALAETSPELAHQAIAELRDDLRTSAQGLDRSWQQTLRTLSAERAALAGNIASERESLVASFDVQRMQLSADADRIVARSIETSWQQARKLVREALLLLIVLVSLLLGLPFAAGYFVGRRTRPADAAR